MFKLKAEAITQRYTKESRRDTKGYYAEVRKEAPRYANLAFDFRYFLCASLWFFVPLRVTAIIQRYTKNYEEAQRGTKGILNIEGYFLLNLAC